jgi:hypothetical protein
MQSNILCCQKILNIKLLLSGSEECSLRKFNWCRCVWGTAETFWVPFPSKQLKLFNVPETAAAFPLVPAWVGAPAQPTLYTVQYTECGHCALLRWAPARPTLHRIWAVFLQCRTQECWKLQGDLITFQNYIHQTVATSPVFSFSCKKLLYSTVQTDLLRGLSLYS